MAGKPTVGEVYSQAVKPSHTNSLAMTMHMALHLPNHKQLVHGHFTYCSPQSPILQTCAGKAPAERQHGLRHRLQSICGLLVLLSGWLFHPTAPPPVYHAMPGRMIMHRHQYDTAVTCTVISACSYLCMCR